jgi:hypothetical protein
MILRIRMKWGTDSGGSGAASEQAALGTVMISEVPHLSQDFYERWRQAASFRVHHLVSAWVVLRRKWGGISKFRSKWGTVSKLAGRHSERSGAPQALLRTRQVRAFLAMMVLREWRRQVAN